jgi:uncharacterized protein
LLFAALLGGFIRRLSGFGGALIMTPMLMWVFPIPFLIPIVMCSEVFGGVLLARQWKLHHDDYSRLWLMLVCAGLFLPLGVWLGHFVPIVLLKILTSTVILCFASYLLFKPEIRIKSTKSRDGFASGLSGFLLGACGIGGPPTALYLNSSQHPYDRTRSLLSYFVSGISIFAIIAASFMGGGINWVSYLVLAIPFYSFGIYLAKRVLMDYPIGDEALKKLCLGLLITNAIFNLILLIIFK